MFTDINKIVIKFVILLFSISFFIGGHILDYSLVLLILAILFFSIRKKEFNFNLNKSLLVIIAFYLMHIIGIIYSENKDIAYFDVEVKASLFAFPLLLLLTSKYVKSIKEIFLKLFVLASSIISLYLIIRVFYHFLFLNDITDFMYSNFSVLLHPSYYAMYLIFSLIIISYVYNQGFCKKKNILILPLLLNIVALFLADSKSGYVSALVIFIYLLINFFYKKSKLYTIVSVSVVIIIGIIMINTNQRLKIMLNVVEDYEKTISKPNNYKESTGLRILSWNAAAQVVKENPITGVGTGDIKQELFKKYEELNYQKNIDIKMNVHNQFIETWLGQGIFGFILLLLVLILPFIDAVKQKNILLQGFLLLIFINFLFESMLNTQAGTIFFGFFYSLLVITNDKD